MPNKYTEKLLSTVHPCGHAPSIYQLERILYENPAVKSYFFIEAFDEDLFDSSHSENEYKYNLYCILATMSDSDINAFRATFN